VQLKDKWRNLVKFRHITPDAAAKLQPKTSGPWSRKNQSTYVYSAGWVSAAPAAATAPCDCAIGRR
jgi:hypothetical protein